MRDLAAASRTTMNTHGWRFSALGAWVAAAEAGLDEFVAHGIVRELAAGALAEGHVEE